MMRVNVKINYHFLPTSQEKFGLSRFGALRCGKKVPNPNLRPTHRETSRDALLNFIVSMENQSACLPL